MKRYALLLIVLLAGCATHGVNGEYSARNTEVAGRHWSLYLNEDGSFAAIRRFDSPHFGPDDTVQLGDESYRGKWIVVGGEVVLKRDDGVEERLAIDTHLGSHILRPTRHDQPLLYWSGVPGYD